MDTTTHGGRNHYRLTGCSLHHLCRATYGRLVTGYGTLHLTTNQSGRATMFHINYALYEIVNGNELMWAAVQFTFTF